MTILGISSFYHDSAAALIKDGKILCAVEEERFSRIKHDNSFPLLAIEECLKSQGLTIEDVDYITYYEKPLLRFERILDNMVLTFPWSFRLFMRALPEWIGNKIKVEYLIKKETGYKGKILFVPHHLSHAALGFFTSPFKEAGILTIDGVGEYQTTALWISRDSLIEPLKEINFPHSIGLLYSTFTAFLGFRVNEGEYKMMGLAAFGTPRYENEIKKIIDIKDDGSFKLDMSYFGFNYRDRMWSNKFKVLFGEPRMEGEEIEKRHEDLAASIQMVVEEIYFKMVNHLKDITKLNNVVISGGVGLNSLANGKIFESTGFPNVHIYGSAGDSGGAIGSALYISHFLSEERVVSNAPSLRLGNRYSNKEIKKIVSAFNIKVEEKREEELIEFVAKKLKDGNVLGWFEGKMEFGPRALGGRSIIASPIGKEMKDRVNFIKNREKFRPFAGSVLEEKVDDLFEAPLGIKSWPFMNFCFQSKKERRNDIMAIVHEDGTSRVQTVSPEDGRYYRLIKKFDELTGVPCVLNTSFNVAGQPIVESPEQAIEAFLKSDIDYLVLENFLLFKE